MKHLKEAQVVARDPAGRPRLLIEEWLPAAAIGVECHRERSTGQQPPDKRLHVWWARRPLAASRAAVLASLLPADFPRDVFERLLGFARPGNQLVQIRRVLDAKPKGTRISIGFDCPRAFSHSLREDDLRTAHAASARVWGPGTTVLDPMAGGGSIPLESARLGYRTMANEYNPVACSILEATVDYPFRFGEPLGPVARKWASVWEKRVCRRLFHFFPERRFAALRDYVFARTVPCPDTGHPTPLVPDWHLLKPKEGLRIVAEPVVDRKQGTWKVRVREVGRRNGQLREAPSPTYGDGKGISLFTDRQIPADYINAKAQTGGMGSALYAVALKTPKGLRFEAPDEADLKGLEDAARELARLRPRWEGEGIIPTERIPVGDKTGDPKGHGTDMPLKRGEQHWADMFSARQLLCLGVLVEEVRNLRPEIVKAEGREVGERVVHLLAFILDKFANHNAVLASWDTTTNGIRSVFDRHDFAFKATFAEMAPCGSGAGLAWAIDNVLEAYDKLAALPRHSVARPVEISVGSATTLPQLADGSVTAVIVDPPYAGNVQYSELADFFYVWLKRTQGHRRPEWFSTYLCEHDQEAVVNLSRHRDSRVAKKGRRDQPTGSARAKAHAFYQRLMTDTFRECRRILRDDGAMTVMFTHKKQEAWEALFTSLITAGFTITATWPIKTESEHSLHQAQKNAAQSTVLLVARKRREDAGIGYFDRAMQHEIQERARATAARLQVEGLNPVDQLLGAFGPAMEVYSRYDEVRTDTGEPVDVSLAMDQASDAVSAWRIEQLARRGLDGVEPEGRFALLCWDVMGAAEFRFNEAKLLGHAVDMDVDQLIAAGLVEKEGDKIRMLPVRERRRSKPLEPDDVTDSLFGPLTGKKRRGRRIDVLKVHPNDSRFRTAIDGCHALALRYLEAGGGLGGIGAAKALARQQKWNAEAPVAKLMDALVRAAPPAVQREKGQKSAAARFPEFRAWHALLEPLFGLQALDWTEPPPPVDLGLPEPEPGAVGEGEGITEVDVEDEDSDVEEVVED